MRAGPLAAAFLALALAAAAAPASADHPAVLARPPSWAPGEVAVDVSTVATDGYTASFHNAAGHSQARITTFGSRQFMAYHDADGSLVLGERSLPAGAWSFHDTGDALRKPSDPHNTPAIGVDADGYLHVAWDHHNQPLKYMRGTVPLGIASFTALDSFTDAPRAACASASNPATTEDCVTYPRFLDVAGTLYVMHRNGSSGCGDVYLKRYDLATQAWQAALPGNVPLVNGCEGFSAADRWGVYWSIAAGADGSLHVLFQWVSTSGSSNTVDLSYVVSRDGGASWATAAGIPAAVPLTRANSLAAVVTPGFVSCTQGMAFGVDGEGSPHWTYMRPEADSFVDAPVAAALLDDPAGTLGSLAAVPPGGRPDVQRLVGKPDPAFWNYHHASVVQGAVVEERLTSFRIPSNSPCEDGTFSGALTLARGLDLVTLFRPGPDEPYVAGRSAAPGLAWEFYEVGHAGRGIGTPIVDVEQWQATGEIHVLETAFGYAGGVATVSPTVELLRLPADWTVVRPAAPADAGALPGPAEAAEAVRAAIGGDGLASAIRFAGQPDGGLGPVVLAQPDGTVPVEVTAAVHDGMSYVPYDGPALLSVATNGVPDAGPAIRSHAVQFDAGVASLDLPSSAFGAVHALLPGDAVFYTMLQVQGPEGLRKSHHAPWDTLLVTPESGPAELALADGLDTVPALGGGFVLRNVYVEA